METLLRFYESLLLPIVFWTQNSNSTEQVQLIFFSRLSVNRPNPVCICPPALSDGDDLSTRFGILNTRYLIGLSYHLFEEFRWFVSKLGSPDPSHWVLLTWLISKLFSHVRTFKKSNQ